MLRQGATRSRGRYCDTVSEHCELRGSTMRLASDRVQTLGPRGLLRCVGEGDREPGVAGADFGDLC